MSEATDNTQEVNDAVDKVVNSGDVQQTIQNEFYIRDLIKTYLDRIEKERDRQKFVTFARGIMQEMTSANGNQPLQRSGNYSYRSVFDLAWEGLYGEDEPTSTEKKEEVAAKPAPVSEPQGVPPVTARRAPGDIQPVADGQEMEDYMEKLGLANYAKARAKLHKMTKTLKTTRASETGLDEIMKELANE